MKTPPYTALWHCGWASSGGYPGAYPARYLQYVKRWIAETEAEYKPVLHLFSGTVHEGTKIDLNPKVNPTHVLDLRSARIPYRDGTFATVLADPPYDHKNYEASKLLCGMEPVPRYSFMPEAIRVLRPGGFLFVLHVFPYKAFPGCDRVGFIGVTAGANSFIRCATIFRRQV